KRGPQFVPNARLFAMGLGDQQDIFDSRIDTSSVQVGALQCAEPYEFGNSKFEGHRCGVRHDSVYVSTEANSIRFETVGLSCEVIESSLKQIACSGCGAVVADTDGATHVTSV